MAVSHVVVRLAGFCVSRIHFRHLSVTREHSDNFVEYFMSVRLLPLNLLEARRDGGFDYFR